MQADGASESKTDQKQPETLAPEAIQFAHRMFNAARQGDDILLHAVDAGLPVNMTNDEGESYLADSSLDLLLISKLIKPV